MFTWFFIDIANIIRSAGEQKHRAEIYFTYWSMRDTIEKQFYIRKL